jgi:hypothetical protein
MGFFGFMEISCSWHNVLEANIWPTKMHNLANKPMPIFFPSHALFGNPM